jgi:uncharacterized membrane protein YccF (DUF307 family)
MKTIGNLIWFLFGGIFMGLAWCFFGLLAFVTIIGIPWGRACFVMAGFSFFPFGKEAIPRDELTLSEDIGTGGLGMLGNIIWFIFAGFWLAIGHVLSAIACFITIIGIPFSLQHLKLAGISIAPIGKTVVSKEVAAAARKANAEVEVSDIRSNT